MMKTSSKKKHEDKIGEENLNEKDLKTIKVKL
jgi:hypothetical protein